MKCGPKKGYKQSPEHIAKRKRFGPPAILRTCQRCQAHFWCEQRFVNYGGGRFCSRACAQNAPTRKPSIVNFIAHVQFEESGCWRWTGFIDNHGYGRFWIAATGESFAHRFAHSFFIGPIAKGFHVDHLCRNRACVNPDHLEAVTPRINLQRSTNPIPLNAFKMTCLRGHPYDEANTYITPNGERSCRACRNIRAREFRARRSAA